VGLNRLATIITFRTSDAEWLERERMQIESRGVDEVQRIVEHVLWLEKNIGKHHVGFMDLLKRELSEEIEEGKKRGIGFKVTNPFASWTLDATEPKSTKLFEPMPDVQWRREVERLFLAPHLMHSNSQRRHTHNYIVNVPPRLHEVIVAGTAVIQSVDSSPLITLSLFPSSYHRAM